MSLSNTEIANLAARVAGPIAAEQRARLGALTPDGTQTIAKEAVALARAIADEAGPDQPTA